MTETKKIIIDENKKMYDPEIPVNIYELGLIYNLEVDEKNNVKVDMTLTSPNCPVAESLPNQVKENIKKIEAVNDVDLQLVWEPPWTKDRMSESAIACPCNAGGIFCGETSNENVLALDIISNGASAHLPPDSQT